MKYTFRCIDAKYSRYGFRHVASTCCVLHSFISFLDFFPISKYFFFKSSNCCLRKQWINIILIWLCRTTLSGDLSSSGCWSFARSFQFLLASRLIWERAEQQYRYCVLRLPRWVGLSPGQTERVWDGFYSKGGLFLLRICLFWSWSWVVCGEWWSFTLFPIFLYAFSSSRVNSKLPNNSIKQDTM